MADNSPFSVVVTTFNRRDYLRSTLASILQQTEPPREVIVVDNQSDYDFFGLLKEIGSPLVRGFQNANMGVIAANRNFGAARATGDYLAFCDDDDLWDIHKLEFQRRVIESSGAGIVFSRVRFIDSLGADCGEGPTIPDTFRGDIFVSLYGQGNFIALSSMAARRSLFFEMGGFSEDRGLITGEDYHFYLRAARLTRFDFCPEPLVDYRRHAKSESAGAARYLATAVKLQRECKRLFPDIPRWLEFKKWGIIGWEYLKKRWFTA